MKFILLSDTHLKADNFDTVFQVFKLAIHHSVKNGRCPIYFLGDFFTARESQNLETMMQAKEILLYLKDEANNEKIDIVFISGNHDKVDLNEEKSYLSIFDWREYRENLKADDGEFILFEELRVRDYPKVRILFLPYFREKDDKLKNILMNEVPELISKNKTNILLTHLAISGVKNNDGSLVSNGLKPKDFFKGFERVFVGHYHDEQKFDNIHYIGSSHQANHGEEISDKGLTLVTVHEDGEIKTKKIQTYFPLYITVDVDFDEITNPSDVVKAVETAAKSVLDKKLKSLRVVLRFEKKTVTTDLKKELRNLLQERFNCNIKIDVVSAEERVVLEKKDSNFTAIKFKPYTDSEIESLLEDFTNRYSDTQELNKKEREFLKKVLD